jgi:hypothetical protein
VAKAAVLLLDLQRDFPGAEGARPPVDAAGAAAVLRTTNAILAKRMVPAALFAEWRWQWGSRRPSDEWPSGVVRDTNKASGGAFCSGPR